VQVNERMKASGDAGSRVFLNAAEVGEQLGLRKSRVYELAAQGLLPIVRRGRRILFPVRGLDALAEAAIQESSNRVLAEDADSLRTH
jgi:excisionase family DNA binding protein